MGTGEEKRRGVRRRGGRVVEEKREPFPRPF